MILRFGPGVSICIYLADLGQIFELLTRETGCPRMLAHDCILVSGIGKHAVFLPVARLVVFFTTFLSASRCTTCRYVIRHA